MIPKKSLMRSSSSESPSPSPLEVKVDNLHERQANGTGDKTFYDKESHGNDVSMTMKASSNGGVGQSQEIGVGRRGSQLKVPYIYILVFNIFISHIIYRKKCSVKVGYGRDDNYVAYLSFGPK